MLPFAIRSRQKWNQQGLEPWKRIQDPTNSIFTKYESGTNKLVTFVTFSDTII